ncbi:MAG: glycosyltransferase [Pseudomonadota bacterium]
MKRLAAFMTYYMRRPAIMRQHLGDAARTLSDRGVKSLLADVRSVSRKIAEDRRLQQVAAAHPALRVPARPAQRPPGGTILVVVHDMALGGAQQVAQSFAAWLARQGRHDVRIVAMRDGPFRAHFEAVAPVFCIADHEIEGPLAVTEALAAWAGPEMRAILVNSVASGRFFDYWPAATPAVAFVHEMPRILARHEAGFAQIAQRAGRVLGGSAAVRDTLAGRPGLPPLSQLYPFVEDEAAHPHAMAEPNASAQPNAGPNAGPNVVAEPDPPAQPDPPVQPHASARRQAARAALQAGPNEILICGCGVLHWRKAPKRFIDVAQRALARSTPPGAKLRFVWIGGGPDLDACRRLVRRKGMEPHVRFTGYRADATELLRAADIFLLPSVEDAFPLVAMHAALAQAPILCFEGAGGTPELVRRGCGAILPNGDVTAMADAVCAYAADPARRAREGAIGRQIVAQEFTVSALGPVLLGHLLSVAARPDAQAAAAPHPAAVQRIAG